MTHGRFPSALPRRLAPTAAPAGNQSRDSFQDEPTLRILIVSIVHQELARHAPKARLVQSKRSRGRRGSGSEAKRQQVWAKERARRKQQHQAQGLLDVSLHEAGRLHRARSISRGMRSWRCAAAESSKKEAAMQVAAEHTDSLTPRKARDHLASKHHYLCWWRALRAAKTAFSPWPDPNAPAFVPVTVPPHGAMTRTRTSVARANTAAHVEAPCLSRSASEGDAKNRSQECSEELSSSEGSVSSSEGSEGEGSEVNTTRAAKAKIRFEKIMQAQLQYELELSQELEGREFEYDYSDEYSGEDSCEDYWDS
jgi:hypothetical protein